MLGDFNAGDYKKRCEDSKFKDYRNNYRKLILEYMDICNGQKTRRMVFPKGFVYETPIDHVLIKDSSELKKSINAKLLR